MKCRACNREIGLGETLWQSHDGLIACCCECCRVIDAKRKQQDAVPEWKQYVRAEMGIEAVGELRSVTLRSTPKGAAVIVQVILPGDIDLSTIAALANAPARFYMGVSQLVPLSAEEAAAAKQREQKGQGTTERVAQ